MNLLLALILPTIVSAGVTCDTINHLNDPAHVLNANNDGCDDVDECASGEFNDCTTGPLGAEGSICVNSVEGQAVLNEWGDEVGHGFSCGCDVANGYFMDPMNLKGHQFYGDCIKVCESGMYSGTNQIGGPMYEFAGLVDDGAGNIVIPDCQDVDECADDALNDCTEDGSICTNGPNPGFDCTCAVGYEETGAAKAHNAYVSCVDVDECRDGWDTTFYDNGAESTAIGDMHGGNVGGKHGCHYNSICTNTLGNYTCSCDAAFFTNPDGGGQGDTCQDIDECTTNTHNCDANAECTNTYGGYTCACNAGFEATTETAQDDNPVCIDIDECPIGGTCMPAGISECVNSPGSYECVCLDSHTGDSCALDADECTTGTATCPEHSTCNNLVFDYECVCDIGWESSVADLCPGPDCDNKASCVDVDECRDGWDSADTANGGFYDNGAESTAIGDMHGGNAGNVHGCNYLAICTNTEGNYTCSCGAGFTGTGEMSTSDFCTDIDECSDETDECDANADCANTQGDYTCTCSTGWEATAATAQDDKQVCIDTDECATNHGGCHANATCTNNDGGHECACVEGYFGNGNLCAEINECEAHAAPGKGPMIGGDHDCHINATCTNTDGSYSCDCEVGTAGNGTYCAESCDDQVYVDHAEWGRLTCENLVNEDRCADDNVYLYCCATCDILTASSTVLSTALPQLLSAMIAVFYLF